ncbi:MAG: Smr/MutS family protein [Pseudomonadota bacterium]
METSGSAPDGTENVRTRVIMESINSLELPRVLEEVSGHALSAPGRDEVLGSSPETERPAVEERLALVSELREMICIHGALPLGGLIPMEGLLESLAGRAAVLNAEEIIAVRDVASLAGVAANRLSGLEPRYGILTALADRFIPLDRLIRRIDDTIDEHGMVKASASRRLSEIRSRLDGARNRIRKLLDDMVRDRELQNVVQEDYVTLRNDRYVVLLRPQFKGYLDGIVHDHSRTGASVYVEPLHVVEHNNQVAALLDEDREEIRRIFKELTAEIREVAEDFGRNYGLLVHLDAYQARAFYASATDATAPELTDEGFRILGARHPLLIAMEGCKVVPMDVIQESGTPATVISGANMGGKTVALKIAGLFPLLTRCGIMVPALEGTRINPFSRVMADIGDEQDIRGGVSSFSGHMLRIKEIIDTVSQGDLVVLDELGGATDPEEGSALAMAAMDELISAGARVVVTTHLTSLKAYAMSNPAVRNVSVEFHPNTLQPTYRLLYDLPGESHAIETAERIGMPERVIRSAQRYVDKSAGGSSKLMAALREELLEAEALRLSLQEREAGLQERIEEIAATKSDMLEEFRREAKDLLKSAEIQIAGLRQSLKEGRPKDQPKPKEVLVQVRAELERGLGLPLEKKGPDFKVGDQVKLKKLGKKGSVLAVPDRGHVEVAVGRMKMRAEVDDVELLQNRSHEKKSSKNDRIRVDIPTARARREVNVIGLRVDDALAVVEKAVDEAMLSGLSSINVIHGKGTGRLKQAIWEALADQSYVRSLRVENIHGGGDGVTVVDLDVD